MRAVTSDPPARNATTNIQVKIDQCRNSKESCPSNCLYLLIVPNMDLSCPLPQLCSMSYKSVMYWAGTVVDELLMLNLYILAVSLAILLAMSLSLSNLRT